MTPPTTLLALETSTLITSVALLVGGELTARDRGGAHSSDLLGLIDEIMAERGVDLAAVDAFAVGVGPGSFTGLRIGMATAKGLAFAAGRPLFAASSLAALALDGAALAPAGALLVPVIDARRGEVFAGCYRADGGAVTALAEDRVMSPAELDAAIGAAAAGGAAVVFGDGLPLVPGLTHARVLDGARATPSAASVARLAAAGRAVDGLRSGPTYLRQAEAEIKFPPGSPVPGTFSKK